MSYQPVSGTVPQYSDDANQLASGFYLKFYVANTTTPLSMATDESGGTLLVKAKLNPNGLPISNPLDNDTVFIPHVDQAYRLVIYRNEADANANNTAAAFLNVSKIEPEIVSLSQFALQGFVGTFGSTADGLAATSATEYFFVTSASKDDLDLYQNDSGAAVLKFSYPSLTTVQNQVDAAAASATDSSNSASAASTSETNAAGSASAASTSETNAANSASAANTSQSNTQALLDQFEDQYWGPFASEPTTSPNGAAAGVGDLYYNTTDTAMYVYDGAVWALVTTAVEGVYDLTEQTNVAGQTTFTIDYDVGLIQVLYNGVHQAQENFTATSGTEVVLTKAVSKATDIITFIRWGAVTQSTFLGTAATQNVGTGAGEIPLNSDLPNSSSVANAATASTLPVRDVNGTFLIGTPTDPAHPFRLGDEQQIGVGQTWQNVIASRAASTTYTNNTGKPILVAISANRINSTQRIILIINVDGTNILRNYSQDSAGSNQMYAGTSFIVPSGSTYSLIADGTVDIWMELR